MEKLMSMDLYALLDISPSASTKEIKTAYRKKALSCHPDKNPNNPLAASLFHELSSVLEILTDPSARSAYDKVVAAREQSKIRSAKLDAKRKKFKDDLEAREERFRKSEDLRGSGKTDEEKLREEIERLQKEGSKLVEEEVAFVNARIHEEVGKKGSDGPGDGSRIKIKWKVAEGDGDNGGYSREVLERIMGKYGDIEVLIVSGGKKGRAIVEFKEKAAAELAVQIERGFLSNPLVLEGLWGEKAAGSRKRGGLAEPVGSRSGGDAKLSFSSAPDLHGDVRGHGDFEEMVLKNLRRAEERKRLLEKMQEEENSAS